jgi:hypothetical protein
MPTQSPPLLVVAGSHQIFLTWLDQHRIIKRSRVQYLYSPTYLYGLKDQPLFLHPTAFDRRDRRFGELLQVAAFACKKLTEQEALEYIEATS